MKYLCFRFDVDTHKCLRDGVPNLLKLAKAYNIHFTFFVNTGRSINHSEFIKQKLRKLKEEQKIYTLSARKKLGMKDYIYVSLLNPLIAASYPLVVKQAYNNGHDIGLHGGRNHEIWYKNAKKWDKEKVYDEVAWGLKQLENIDKKIKPSGFASPGWSGSEKVNRVLENLGFIYVADIHTDKPEEKIKGTKKLKLIPTNIAGEPGGVGYIEHCRAVGMDDKHIINDFKKKLSERKHLAIMYDHPYYVGVQELPLLEQLIKTGLEMKYTFVTMKELIQKHI